MSREQYFEPVQIILKVCHQAYLTWKYILCAIYLMPKIPLLHSLWKELLGVRFIFSLVITISDSVPDVHYYLLVLVGPYSYLFGTFLQTMGIKIFVG